MRPPGKRTDVVVAFAAFAVVAIVAVWIVSPSFSISGPFVIDDWWSVKAAPAAFDSLRSLHYDASAIGDPKRYRPAYTGGWNWLQWHTFGAPRNMTGPHVWNALRTVAFFGALTALTLALLQGLPPDRRSRGAWLGLLANVPGVALLATPGLPIAFARFGPQEPLMIAGMAGGALLLCLGLRRVLAGEAGTVWKRLLTAAVLAVGYVCWIFGIYMKEASIVALALGPFVYLYLDKRWRGEGVTTRPLWRSRAARLLGVAMALPLLHMSLEVLRRADVTIVYGIAPPSGLRGWASRLSNAVNDGFLSLPGLLPTLWWQYLIACLPFFVFATMVWRRRIDWAVAGLLVTAAGVWAFQGMSGHWDSRYYIPSLALFAIVAVAGTPLSRRSVAPIIVAAAVFTLATNASDRRAAIVSYAESVKAYVSAIKLSASYHPGSCRVYLANMNIEFASAWPTLVATHPEARSGPCDDAYEAILLTAPTPGGDTNPSIIDVCGDRGWQVIHSEMAIKVSGCKRLLKGRPRGKGLKGQYVEDILRWNRLEPGVTLSERLNNPAKGPFCRAPVCAPALNALKASR